MSNDRPNANDLMALLRTFEPRLSQILALTEDHANIILEVEQFADLIETELVLDPVDFYLMHIARTLLQNHHPVAALERLERILQPRCVSEDSR